METARNPQEASLLDPNYKTIRLIVKNADESTSPRQIVHLCNFIADLTVDLIIFI